MILKTDEMKAKEDIKKSLTAINVNPQLIWPAIYQQNKKLKYEY